MALNPILVGVAMLIKQHFVFVCCTTRVSLTGFFASCIVCVQMAAAAAPAVCEYCGDPRCSGRVDSNHYFPLPDDKRSCGACGKYIMRPFKATCGSACFDVLCGPEYTNYSIGADIAFNEHCKRNSLCACGKKDCVDDPAECARSQHRRAMLWYSKNGGCIRKALAEHPAQKLRDECSLEGKHIALDLIRALKKDSNAHLVRALRTLLGIDAAPRRTRSSRSRSPVKHSRSRSRSRSPPSAREANAPAAAVTSSVPRTTSSYFSLSAAYHVRADGCRCCRRCCSQTR